MRILREVAYIRNDSFPPPFISITTCFLPSTIRVGDLQKFSLAQCQRHTIAVHAE